MPIDYTSRDFVGLRSSLLEYARTAFPEWHPASEGDFGVLVVELLAYLGDILSYYVDRAQYEAYLTTATQRASILNIARLLGYKPDTGTPAVATVSLVASDPTVAVVVPARTRLASAFLDSVDGPVVFETDEQVEIIPGEPFQSVGVTEGITHQDETDGSPLHLVNSTGYPAQVYRLPHPNVYRDSVEIYVAGEAWHQIEHILEATSFEKVFTVDIDGSGYVWVTFGDGINGAVPALGVEITTRYRTGVGSKGNLPEGSIVSIYSNNTSGFAIQMANSTSSTSSASAGGTDPESNDQIRANAPRAFATHQRAISVEDFASLAAAVPGVSKANAAAAFFSSVTVYVLGPDGTTASDALLDRVQTSLEPRSLAGVSLTVAAPDTVEINLGTEDYPVSVQAWPQFSNSKVYFEVQQAIKNWLSFSIREIGDTLTLASLYSTIMDVEGVRYVNIPVMARADAVQEGTDDIVLKAWEFPVEGDIILDPVTGGTG